MNFFFDMAVSVVLTVLKEVIKNKEKKAEVRKAMLKISNSIAAAYADDQDFA